jgi:hypothetical protein
VGKETQYTVDQTIRRSDASAEALAKVDDQKMTLFELSAWHDRANLPAVASGLGLRFRASPGLRNDRALWQGPKKMPPRRKAF